LLVETEIAMRCIRIYAIEGQFNSDRYYQLYHTCTKINAKNGRTEILYGSLFVKKNHYLVGSTSKDTLLHLNGLQELPMDEFGYVQHSFKKDSKFPNNLVFKKEHNTKGYLYDHNKL
jgi:hypothetical protein